MPRYNKQKHVLCVNIIATKFIIHKSCCDCIDNPIVKLKENLIRFRSDCTVLFFWRSTCGDLPRFNPIAHIEFGNVLCAYILMYARTRVYTYTHVWDKNKNKNKKPTSRQFVIIGYVHQKRNCKTERLYTPCF